MHARLFGYAFVGLLAPSVATAAGEIPPPDEPPAYENGMPEHDNSVPDYGDGKPEHDNGVPDYGGGEPEHGNGMPDYGGGEPEHDNGMPEMDEVLSDAEILGILQAANAGMIATGQQAQYKADFKSVREFGARMVAEHSAAGEQLALLAARLELDPATSRVSEYLAKTADHILTASECYAGPSYDVLYIDGQLYLHSLVVGLVDWLGSEADASELRDAILELRPVILDHLDAATVLRRKLGNPPDAYVK